MNSLRQTFEAPRDEDQRDAEQKMLALATVLFWSLIFALGGAWLA